MEAQLDSIFQQPIDSKRIPGAAAVALDTNGKVLFSKGYGHTVAGDSSSPKVEPSTPLMIWSCTKLVTCVAMLQLLEQGKIDLMDPAAKYWPDIKKIPLLKGWKSDGSPEYVENDKEILILHLFTHTSGMAYDFFHKAIMKYRIHAGQNPVAYVTQSTMEEYTTPLVFPPGEGYEYGPSIDFLGLIIGKISGMSLDQYIDKNIIQPLGLKNTGVGLNHDQLKRFFTVHAKDPEGNLTSTPLRMKESPEVMPGGHYLYSSTEDYANFLLALLNNGTHPKNGAQILKPETVKKYIFTDMLPTVGCSSKGVGDIPSTAPPATCTGAMLPGINKGWSCGGLINNEDVPDRRRKGSMAWAGLGNCYFWVDPAGGKLGFVTTAVLPFFDKDVLQLADALERTVYGHADSQQTAIFSGGNYAVAVEA
jgi:methyl acetate hydrolase